MDVLEMVMEVACVAGLAAALGIAAATDLAHRIVPNGCVVAVALLGAVRAAARGAVPAAALGAAVVLAVMLAAAAASERLCGRPGVGGGDVKLLAAAGVWTGPALGLAVVGASCLLGLAGRAAGQVAARVRGGPRRSGGIPLAPAVAVATLVAVLGGTSAAP